VEGYLIVGNMHGWRFGMAKRICVEMLREVGGYVTETRDAISFNFQL